jgi:transcriptional regulator with XRE-family HTH domain
MSKREVDIDDKLIAQIAKRCADLREKRNLSLQEAGDRAGFTKSHMWEFEQGRSANPSIRMLLGLARAYGVSLDYIVGLNTAEPHLHPEALRIAGDVDRLLRNSGRR